MLESLRKGVWKEVLVGKDWTLNCTGLTYLYFHKLHQIELIVSKNLSNEGNWLWISLLNLNLD